MSRWPVSKSVVAAGSGELPGLATPAPPDLPGLATEVSLARRLLGLPILASASLAELTSMAALSQACLLAALSVSELAGEAGLGEQALQLGQDAVDLAQALANTARASSRLGPGYCMNLTCCTGWLLLAGLRAQLAGPAPPCSPLTVCLAELLLSCLGSLTGDLEQEPDLSCAPAQLQLVTVINPEPESETELQNELEPQSNQCKAVASETIEAEAGEEEVENLLELAMAEVQQAATQFRRREV